MLRGTGLTQPEPPNEVPNQPRLLPQQIENLPASRLSEDFERNAHTRYITTKLYSCQGMNAHAGAVTVGVPGPGRRGPERECLPERKPAALG